MKFYTIVVMANKTKNDGEKDYSQEFRAIDESSGLCCAIHYQGNNILGNKFYHKVMERNVVKAESGESAIFKFQKWQREGLDEDYLHN